MPTIKMTLAETAAKSRPFTAAQRARFAALEQDDSLIDFSDQEEITPAKIAAGRHVVVGRGGARPGAGRKPTGHRRQMLSLPPAVIRRAKAEAGRRGLTLSAYVAEKLAS